MGANIGYQTLEFALIANKGGKVYAWEPHPSNYLALRTNLEQNGLDSGVVTFNNAVGDDIYTICFTSLVDHEQSVKGYFNNGDIRLPVNSKDTTCNSVKNEISVSTMRVDTVDVDRLDLIKIDVQGYEQKALNSALATILKFKPAIIIEFEELQMKRLKYGTVDIVNFIKNSMNYEVFFIAYAYPSDHLLIAQDRVAEFRKKFNGFIYPLTVPNDVNSNIAAGVTEQICYPSHVCWPF